MDRHRSWALALALVASAAFSASSGPGPAAGFGPAEFQPLLQRFVKERHGRSFLALGEEADFDHAHLLFRPGEDRPFALLYHTQELSSDPSLSDRNRNWLQWVGTGDVEDAKRYERRTYPRSAAWDWFLEIDLPSLRKRGTILDKMLDPSLLGSEETVSRQWVFQKTPCGGRLGGRDKLRVDLPAGQQVCLGLERP
ncbi:MAG: hypothetical protein HY924_09695 [Elusimicrobia bacterium]|nr:hypothetical protein [Elusimicrobiota bacterium]